MQKVSSWPSHEKEMEIFRLQRSLAEKERVQATSEVLCRSLSDETNQLRCKLTATAEMCQQLVTCLEDAHRKNGGPPQEQQVCSVFVTRLLVWRMSTVSMYAALPDSSLLFWVTFQGL